MKYLALCLLLLSTMAFGFGPSSGRKQECLRPNVLVDLASLPENSRAYEKCKLARTPKCCVENSVANPPRECTPPNIMVDYTTIPKETNEFRKCRILFGTTGNKMCCVDPKIMQECRKPKTLINLDTARLTKAAYVLCKENLIPGTHDCCIDLSTVVEAPICPRGTILTELGSLKENDPRYKECINALLPGTKNCCLKAITKLLDSGIKQLKR